MTTFKCWFIANFEIAMLIFTAIISTIICCIFSGTEEVFSVLFQSILLLVVWTFPTNRSNLQFGKYIVMLGGAILLTYGAKNEGWTFINDETGKDMLSTFITWLWVIFSIATVISGWLAYYTYINISEVVSRRMLWRNSNVNLLEFSLRYTLERFCNATVSIVTCALEIILIIMVIHLSKNM